MPLTRENITERLAGGDFTAPQTGGTPAAVLVALVEHAHGFGVLLTRRTDHLAHHPGQISFPGGRFEAADRDDPIACALRETEEEIGLPARAVTILGRMPDIRTGTGFRITPVVGVVTPPVTLAADPFEVAEVFEAPLAFLLDSRHHDHHEHQPAHWAIRWNGRLIWGATALMLVNLSIRLGCRAA